MVLKSCCVFKGLKTIEAFIKIQTANLRGLKCKLQEQISETQWTEVFTNFYRRDNDFFEGYNQTSGQKVTDNSNFHIHYQFALQDHHNNALILHVFRNKTKKGLLMFSTNTDKVRIGVNHKVSQLFANSKNQLVFWPRAPVENLLRSDSI